MNKKPGVCPYCGGESGFYQRMITDYRQYYTWEGESDYTDDGAGKLTKTFKRRQCLDCDKVIPKKYLPEELIYE